MTSPTPPFSSAPSEDSDTPRDLNVQTVQPVPTSSEDSETPLVTASDLATQTKKTNKRKKEKPAPRIHRAIRSNATHRCPLHESSAECKGVRIDPKLETINSYLTGEIKITFKNASEKMRDLTVGSSSMRPSTLYRTFYETSVTLSSRVSKDTHVRHRENEHLKLRPGNAFQTVGEVQFQDNLTKEGIERHLVWNKKENPSTWISMFNELSHAKRRAHFHYDESKRIGQRVTIAEISTADLIAATVHATCVSVWEILFKDKYLGWDLHYNVTTRDVQIPIWVHKSVRPADGSSITPEQLMASNADLFVSIQELRHSSLVDGPRTHSRRRTITADGHNYEWLALGRIRESRIMKVIPFDGNIFYTTKPTSVVRSEAATEDWIFDFDLETWRLESEMKKAEALRRKRTEPDDTEAEEKKKRGKNASQTHKNTGDNLDFSIITTIIDNF